MSTTSHLFCTEACETTWTADILQNYADQLELLLGEAGEDYRTMREGERQCLGCGTLLFPLDDMAQPGYEPRYLLAHPETSDRYYGFGWRAIERSKWAIMIGGPASSLEWMQMRLASGARALGDTVYTSREEARAGIVGCWV